MKHFIIMAAFILIGCASHDRKSWDSGGDAQRAYDQQQMQEQVETMRVQQPGGRY